MEMQRWGQIVTCKGIFRHMNKSKNDVRFLSVAFQLPSDGNQQYCDVSRLMSILHLFPLEK